MTNPTVAVTESNACFDGFVNPNAVTFNAQLLNKVMLEICRMVYKTIPGGTPSYTGSVGSTGAALKQCLSPQAVANALGSANVFSANNATTTCAAIGDSSFYGVGASLQVRNIDPLKCGDLQNAFKSLFDECVSNIPGDVAKAYALIALVAIPALIIGYAVYQRAANNKTLLETFPFLTKCCGDSDSSRYGREPAYIAPGVPYHGSHA